MFVSTATVTVPASIGTERNDEDNTASVSRALCRPCPIQWTLFRYDVMGGKVGTKWIKYMQTRMFYTRKHENTHVLYTKA